MTPIAAMTMPPHQHTAETTPALRGPARSSQPPQSAADEPRNTKKRVYIHPRSATRQSHVVVNSARPSVRSGQATGCVTPSARDSGSQKTLKAVRHADAEVNRERRGRDEPAVESRSRNDAFPIEKSRRWLRGGYFHGITDT
jgi:hypothetical protein